MAINEIKEIFMKNKNGRLMKVEESEYTRYSFEIWFEYTRQLMTQLKEGTLIAIKNFNSDQTADHFSVLEVNSIMPVHYAMDPYASGYPGFELEAARNIASDWTSQDDKSNEDTTIIKCSATPTGTEIFQSMTSAKIGTDLSIPMLGQEAMILASDAAREVINLEISSRKVGVFEGGKWLADSEIPIFIDNDGLLRLHFGIFGYTGAGKSNLVSTYISKIFEESDSKRAIKIILFDLLSEYSTLLIDQIYGIEHGFLLGLGANTFPISTLEYLRGDISFLKKASEDLVNTSLYPRKLENSKDNFRNAVRTLLETKKVRLYQQRLPMLRDLLYENLETLRFGNLGGFKGYVNQFIFNIERLSNRILDKELLGSLRTATEKLINGNIGKKEKNDHQSSFDTDYEEIKTDNTNSSLVDQFLQGIDFQTNPGNTAIGNLNTFRIQIDIEIQKLSTSSEFPEESILSTDQIISDLNDPNHSSLYVVQSHNPDSLRELAFSLGNRLFDVRRANGLTAPIVSFVFDEADEFIPGDPGLTGSYKKSVEIVEMLARRGRKYGLGIGICTQRTTYLKTSVMAQPHTYLVSKLPRATDRQRVTEAFGLSDKIFNQTFRFDSGDWLLTSTDATGLRGVPIPIHAMDANERLTNFLQSINGTTK